MRGYAILAENPHESARNSLIDSLQDAPNHVRCHPESPPAAGVRDLLYHDLLGSSAE